MDSMHRERNRVRGQLRNGNPSGDPNTAPRCGAQTRRGTECLGPAMRGKRRCRMHGGRSAGPRTPEGLERCRRANWTHGRHSVATRQARAEAIAASLAAIWKENEPLLAMGFTATPVRRRGFHGFRYRSEDPFPRLKAALKELALMHRSTNKSGQTRRKR
jgi:hypothetical protein